MCTGIPAPPTGSHPSVLPHGLNQISPSLKVTTGNLNVPNYEQTSQGTIRLTGPMKVVQVPVAAQPGQYTTGLLPVPPNHLPADSAQTSSKRLPNISSPFTIALLLT